MTRRVMGMETEYAISGKYVNGENIDKNQMSKALVQMAADKLVNLPAGAEVGLFLANGSRFYKDSGNHPEISTPECLTPWEVARYVAAGDMIIQGLAEEVCNRMDEVQSLDIAKVNVDYSGSSTTWGSHESYSHMIAGTEFYNLLIPHLVSRIIYSGAGGFDSLAPGLAFTVSPRAHHMKEAISGSSTNDRGIIHTKNEDLSNGLCNRLHLLCGESLFSQTGAVLKVGTTALVLSLLERGNDSLNELRLADPVKAMRTISRDPTCQVKVELINGSFASALEIQHKYLDLVENGLQENWLPVWAEQICQLWRQTLSDLEEDPSSVCRTLDWGIKNFFFEKFIRERGFQAQRVFRWNEFLNLLFLRLVDANLMLENQIRYHLLNAENMNLHLAAYVDNLLLEQRLDKAELHDFLALRRDLFMLDTKFTQLGKDGVFEGLQVAGVLSHKLPEVGDVRAAKGQPPTGTRAYLRGLAIKALAGQIGENYCNWDSVVNQERGIRLNLRDPFEQNEQWTPFKSKNRRSRSVHRRTRGTDDFLDLLHQLDM